MEKSSAPNLHRRSFLKAAGRLGRVAAAGSILPIGLSTLGSRARLQAKTQTPEPLIQPSETRSANGILDTTITAAPGPVQLGDRSFGGLLYNGAYVPPTLRARLGDTLRITFRNNLIDRSQLDHSGYLGPICTGADLHGLPVEPALSRHERVATGQQ